MARFRLLSIDGGGIRGLIPALILEYIEKQTKRPICELFDGIAGTSTGGILALGLSAPRPVSNGLTRTSELVQLYQEQAPIIFKESEPWRSIHKLTGSFGLVREIEAKLGTPRDEDLHDLFRPRFPATGRAKVLRDFFGDTPLSAARSRLFITSYDTEGRTPVFFVSRPEDVAQDDFYVAAMDGISMFDAAMATSAAPTYFPPHKVLKGDGHFSLIDGSIFANNPTGLAQAFLKDGDTTYEDDVVLSLGTGSLERQYRFEDIEHWGLIRWASPSLKMMLDGQTEAVAMVLHRRLRKAHYLRIQGLVGDTNVADDLDDTRPSNLDNIRKLAERLIDRNAAALDALCRVL